MEYNSHEYFGMHFFWWIVWVLFLLWIFAIPYNIPGQRMKRDSPLHILKKRFALGEITETEFNDMKKLLEI